MICPECSKNPTLPGFSWCRGCISRLADDYHASDKKRWFEEARQEELSACSALAQWLQFSQRAQPGRCWICGAKTPSIYGATYPYCAQEEDALNIEWGFCAVLDCYRWTAKTHHCADHGGRDYTPRTTR